MGESLMLLRPLASRISGPPTLYPLPSRCVVFPAIPSIHCSSFVCRPVAVVVAQVYDPRGGDDAVKLGCGDERHASTP